MVSIIHLGTLKLFWPALESGKRCGIAIYITFQKINPLNFHSLFSRLFIKPYSNWLYLDHFVIHFPVYANLWHPAQGLVYMSQNRVNQFSLRTFSNYYSSFYASLEMIKRIVYSAPTI